MSTASMMSAASTRAVRRLVPLLLVPLCLAASVLSAAPWLRSFPVSLAGAPIYGAAVLSVLVPLVVTRIRPRWLWLGLASDVVAFVAYGLLVVLCDPGGWSDLVQGVYRGPSQILTFALPLVSPRSLMLAPVALSWLAGALAGECLARRWYTMLPFVGFLVSFGLAYAGTQRAAGADLAAARSHETLLAAGPLIALLLLRIAQSWVRQDETAESTQADGILPLRGLVVGFATAAAVVVIASLAVQTSVFPNHADTPQRIPSVDDLHPLTPIAFISELRPATLGTPPRTVFSVSTDRASTGYFGIANVDLYDGTGWSFDRTFRPSGGVLPADTDAALQGKSVVTQQYRIGAGGLTAAPWMPLLYRAQRVTGTPVNIDPSSGMIVPARALANGTSYTVQSAVDPHTFAQLRTATASADMATPVIDTQLPAALQPTLDRIITAFTIETGVPSSPALPFLQALRTDLQTNYALSGAAQGSATGPSSAPGTSAPRSSAPRSSSPSTRTSQSTPQSSQSKRRPTAHARSPRHALSGTRHSPLTARLTSRARPLAARASASRTPSRRSIQPARGPVVAAPTARPSDTSSAAALAGGTGFADVLASILGQRTGTPEQYATLIALIARQLGVPARVATGFRVLPATAGSELAAGSYDVTDAEAWSWVEIPVLGAGWMVLDASPGRFAQNNQPTQSGAAPAPPTSQPPTPNALVTQGRNGRGVDKASPVPQTTSKAGEPLLITLLVVIGVLLLVLLLIFMFRKRVRAARRRRSPDPRTRLIGAWQESLDVLTESGLPELTAMTSSEIADLTDEQFGAESGADVRSLGVAANAVAYSASTVISPEDADLGWTRHSTLRKAIRRQLGVRGRVAADLRYHRPKQATRPTSPESWATATAAAHGRESSRSYRGRRRAH